MIHPISDTTHEPDKMIEKGFATSRTGALKEIVGRTEFELGAHSGVLYPP
jgi:hypothetical protein